MNANHKNPKEMLNAAVDAMRTAEPEHKDMENRAARVWARIGRELSQNGATASSQSSAEPIRSCEDYRALIPDYIAGRLPAARALLFKDHTHECVACRNALNAARDGEKRPVVLHAERRFTQRASLALAAAAVLVFGVVLQQAGYLNFLLPVVEVHAMARTIDGKLYRVSGLNMSPVSAGEALAAGEPVRTAAGSRAVVELADGTRIEMRERSQLSLRGMHDGIRINLDRGSVIVQAAKQRDGHLYVGTEDATVSVVGTVFAVSTGVKGSRVSVLEGEVHVAQNASPEKALYPGQQLTTTPALTPVSIEDEISWSGNLDTHLALLRVLADVNAFLRDRVPGPQLRFKSTLLPLLPANTMVYGAFPNVSSALGQAYDLFRLKIDQNPTLQSWWAKQNTRKDPADPTLEEMIAHVRTLGGHLGDEIAIAVTGSGDGPGDIMVLADVRDAAGALSEINAIIARTSPQEAIPVLTDPTQLANFKGDERGPVGFIGGSILAFASSPKAIYDIVVAQHGGGSAFAAKPFYASIAQSYAEGAATLFAADLATMFASAQTSKPAQFMGISDVGRLVFEQKQVNGKTMTRAQVNFTNERSGVAAWLAPAAAMGALEFVSPQAYGMASVVTKDAGTIVSEILAFGQSQGKNDPFADIQRETGIDVRRDLAEPLGGEFLFAIDGPFLPTPSWKIVAEVYDSARLQSTIERLVTQANTHIEQAGYPPVTLSSEAVGGQVYYRLHAASGVMPEINYTYALGYFIAAPSRALVTQALQYQQTRSSLASSAKFRSMMPADGADYCSAILYQNLTDAASSLASYIPSGAISSQQLQTMQQTVQMTPPTLVCATGEPNRIVMGYQGDLAFNVLMMGGLRSMLQTIGGVQ